MVDNEKRFTATAQLHPATNATETCLESAKAFPDIDRSALFQEFIEQIKFIKEGNLERPEEIMIVQAHTLDNLYTEMISLGRKNLGNINVSEKFIRLALKAQAQCRTTLETLYNIKNPKPYIQNNHAEYQQVNNSHFPKSSIGNKNLGNELLEDKKDEQEWMDIGTSQETV